MDHVTRGRQDVHRVVDDGQSENRRRVTTLGFLTVVALSVCLAMVAASPARAATFVVTSTNDSGPGSLRQAVSDANGAPGADTITFSVTGTIVLTTGVITVTGPLTIDGPGLTSLTVSGSRSSGILQVVSGGTLTIRHVTLSDGYSSSGGAIINLGGQVTVANAVLSGNTASGGAGGAIVSAFAGTVTVEDSTFSGNSAFAGGAIEISGGSTLRVANSTFTGNTALPGGAISNAGGAVEITNSTFSGNSAVVGGALYNLTFATFDITNSTFAGNSASQGAAIENLGLDVTVANSIFAGDACLGPIVDGGGNLDWPASSCPGLEGDPALGALADNGGATQTMALGPGSAAIDAAIPGLCPAADQRGVSRPHGSGCDIGAYESDAALDSTPPVVEVPDDLTADATGPTGAVVSFEVAAADDVDGSVPVDCAPPSLSIFSIGTTTVTCTAADAAGNSASASFDVHVKGASEQLADLAAGVAGVGPGTSLADKVAAAIAAVAAHDAAGACTILAALDNELSAQSGRSIPRTQAEELRSTATRIRSVLAC